MPPRLLVSAVLVTLGLLHYYVGLRLIPHLALPPLGEVLAWLALLASWLAIPAGLLARGIRRQPLADRLAWLGFGTMGLWSSLLVLTVLRDISLLGASLFDAHTPMLEMASARAVPFIAVAVTLAGWINARRLARVVDVEVPLKGLPPSLEGFRIAQISDIHVGPTIKRDYLERIVARVNALNPDLIAITGDLVDGSVAELAAHTAPLARLRARHGSYFVTGNHEYYANAAAWFEEIQRLGTRVLLNEHVLIQHAEAQLVLAGVTDYTAHHFEASHRSDPAAAIAGAPAAAPRILLAHQPRSAEAAARAGFDLQLSGHTHGGQFLPWNLFVPLQQPFTAGLHRLQDLWVYVSRGTGYWGPPKRFGAPSEITCLRLVRAPE